MESLGSILSIVKSRISLHFAKNPFSIFVGELKTNMEGGMNMQLSELLQYVNMVTLGICLCVGYVLKSIFSKFPNRWIPVVMLALGVVVNIVMFHDLRPANILSGMISGLVSTGSYEVFKNIFMDKKNSGQTDEHNHGKNDDQD